MPDWDERYLRGAHDTKEPSPLLPSAIKHLKPGRALDLACGTGRHAIFLANHGWQVTAVDSSRVGIEILKERAAERSVHSSAGDAPASCLSLIDARVADLEKGEFRIAPEAYELICIFYYLQRDLFAAIREGVKPGGTVVAAIHLNDGRPEAKPHNPAFLLERGELRKLFSDWEIQHYHEGPSDEGGHHHDTAYLIARRPDR
jgi:tellurite methyltransferase